MRELAAREDAVEGFDESYQHALELEQEAEEIRLAQAGDTEALSNLCSRHYSSVLNIARHHATSEDMAQDATQDTFMRMVRKIKDFENRGDGLAPWLQTIVKNSIINHFRYGKRHPSQSLDCDEHTYDHMPDHKLDFEEEVIERLDSDRILQEIAAAIKPERFEIMKALVEGETNLEMAERLGINRMTIGSRLSKGRKQLVEGGYKELVHSQVNPS